MRIVSLIRYPVSLKSDMGMIKINGKRGDNLVGDGITHVEDNVWRSVMKYNERFLERCKKRGSLIWEEFHVDTPAETPVEEEKPVEKPAKKGKKKKDEVKEEAPVEVKEEAPAEEVAKEELTTEAEAEEDVLAKAESLIEG